MKILAILITLFSIQAFANFDGFISKYNELVFDDTYGEMILDYEILSYDSSSTGQIVAQIATSYPGLYDLKLFELEKKDELYSQLENQTGYFCERLVRDYYSVSNDDAKCILKLKELLTSIVDDQSIDSISIIRTYGDYYGDYEAVYIIGHDYSHQKVLKVELDIVHEI